MNNSIKKQEKARPGRKASGLRDLSPEAARLAISRAALRAIEAPMPTDLTPVQRDVRRAEIARVALKPEANTVRRAVGLADRAVKATGMSGGIPTLERLLREDVAIGSLQTVEDGQFAIRPVMRSKTMRDVLLAAGVERHLARTAEMFTADVERASIGRLTASYGEGLGGGVTAEPLRVLEALDRLGRAQERLTRKERTAVWGYLVLGISATDVGWALVGHAMAKPTGGERDMRTATALICEAGLERMSVFYEAMA